MDRLNLAEAFKDLSAALAPDPRGEIAGFHVRTRDVVGVTDWLQHETEDQILLVIEGRFRVLFDDRVVDLNTGQFVMVPRGERYRPEPLDLDCHVVRLEPILGAPAPATPSPNPILV